MGISRVFLYAALFRIAHAVKFVFCQWYYCAKLAGILLAFFIFRGCPCFEARMTLVREVLTSWTSGTLLPQVIPAFFVGTLLGGAISGLPFELEAITTGNIMMCLLSKMLLTAVFVPIFLVVSVIDKQKTWLTIVGSFVVSMLLFTIIPLFTLLNATITNVVLCLVGGVLFSILLGKVSSLILSKCDLI